MGTERPLPPPAMPLGVMALAFIGAMSALAGGYWDDAWHTERGRDSFFIAPHLAIYLGITAAGGALSVWALHVARTRGTAAVWSHRPLALALVSVTVTLLSAPIDNAWHVAFGRDAVIWSPPHMLGIVGTLALGAAVLAEVAGRHDRTSQIVTALAGALVLSSAAFSTVEYDTDVPQFDEVFFLPVLGFATAVALALVRVASTASWAAVTATAAYTLFIVLVGLFLAAVGFPPPALPLLLIAAVAVDVGWRRGWHPLLTAAVFTVLLHAAYVPIRNGLGDGVRLDAEDVLIGAALTFATTAAVFAVAAGQRPRLSARSGHAIAAVAAALMVAGISAPNAEAHDPGQGDDAGTVALKIAVNDGVATVDAELDPRSCGDQPVAVVARRAGQERRGPLQRNGCRLSGTVPVSARGRWFVYVELRRGSRPVESWLPVEVRDGSASVDDPARYAYFPAERSDSVLKAAGGVVLYGGVLALLYATYGLIAASRRQREALPGPVA